MRRSLCLVALTVLVAVVLFSSGSPPASASGMAAVSCGGWHTCALMSTGGVKCWGYNHYGQLGDGTDVGRRTPAYAIGLTAGIAAVSTGETHSCALSASGGVKCWGYNSFGKLGDGANVDRSAPVDVVGLSSGVVAISGGGAHTCALTAAGGVKCWGYNSFGQLGDGSTTDRNVPVDVLGLTSGVIAVGAGQDHTCAVTMAGGVKCWGLNSEGQLGDGTTVDRQTPVDVSGLSSGVVTVAGGNGHTCALTTAGGVKCWGRNGGGQLGDGTTTERHGAGDVSGLTTGVAGVAAGWDHTCAVTTAGGVKCWGFNGDGQLGDGTTVDRHTPIDVLNLHANAASITAGHFYTCALTVFGRIECWGENYLGQLGDGTSDERLLPVYTADAVYWDTLASPLSVPDADPTGVSDSITVGGAGVVEDLNVSLGMSHTWVGDLVVTLTHEDTNTSAVLIDRPGMAEGDLGCGSDDILTVLDDEAQLTTEEMCEDTPPAITRSGRPNQPLSLFDGESMQGTWTLHVSDNAHIDTGTLDEWGLIAVGKPPAPAPAPTSTNTPTPAPTSTNTPTPAPTSTNTPAPAPTSTNTPPLAPTATPTDGGPTPTLPLAGLDGDVNCDGTVNSIDATLVLQFNAGLIASLACQEHADVNEDGIINSIDATLILQYTAGLIPSLPP